MYQLSRHSETRGHPNYSDGKSKLNSLFRRAGVAALQFGPLGDAAVREKVLGTLCLSATSRASAQQHRNADSLRALLRRLGPLRTKPGIQRDRG
jgi:hypothetical protein